MRAWWVAMAVAVACSAAPAKAATWTVPLDGVWQAQRAEGRPADRYAAKANGDWTPMRLPGRWHQRGLPTQGAVWLTREFVVNTAHPRGWLDIAGADYFTDAWLDGRHVGFHEGGSAPFRLALGAIEPGRHRLTLRVDSPYEPFGSVWSLNKRLLRGVANHHDTRPGGAWDPRGQDANSGGVWGSVKLKLTGASAIERLDVRPRVAGARAWLGLGVAIDHQGPATSGRLEVTLTPIGFSGAAQTFERPVRLKAGRQAVDAEWAVAAPRLWSTWDRGTPHRYRLGVKLRVGGAVSDAAERPVGLRSVERLQDGTFALNGQRLFLRGTNYISSPWPDDTDAPRLRGDVALMREANMNAVRVHAHVEPDAFYDACDAAGLLVWQDLPLQWGYADTPEVHGAALTLAREVVAGYGHHPAVFAWCAQNEAPYSAEWMQYKYPAYDPNQNRELDAKLVAALRRADPTRYAHPNSDTAEHPWLGWYSGSWLDYAKPTKESLITEYGAQALPEEATLRAIFPAWALWPTDERAWKLWDYHNFQRHEMFDLAKVPQGPNLAAWIANSQAYQGKLTAFAAERYRLQKYQPVGAIFQFHLVDPWPSVGWGALDHLRRPKAGYTAMQRSYQPTLPIAEALPVQPAGQPFQLPVRVVHDRPYEVRRAKLETTFLRPDPKNPRMGGMDEVTFSSRLVLPADGVSHAVSFQMPGRPPGTYRQEFRVTAEGVELGRNVFEWTVE